MDTKPQASCQIKPFRRCNRIILTCSLFLSLLTSASAFSEPAPAPVVTSAVGSVKPSPQALAQGKREFLMGNYTSAFKQLVPVAKLGDANAQYAVGYMLYYGLGTKMDRHQAYYWTQQAASQGLPEAKQALSHYTQQDKAVPHRKTKTLPVAKTNQLTSTDEVLKKPAQPVAKHAVVISSQLPAKLASQEQQIMALPNDHYTLQVMGSHDYKKLERSAQRYQITDAIVFRTYFQGRYWYVLTSGNFDNKIEAKQAAANIKEQAPNLHPWVRQVSSVKNEIQQIKASSKIQ